VALINSIVHVSFHISCLLWLCRYLVPFRSY